MHSSEYCQQLPKLSWRFWDISNASFTVRLTDFRFDCTVLNHVTSWRSFQTFQRKCKHNLLSINTVVHSHYMKVPEDKETPGLHGWGTNWLAGPLPDFCIVNKLVPLDNKQSPQTPLIDSTDFPCIRLVTAQHSEPYMKNGKMHVLYNFNFIAVEMRDLKIWLSKLCMAMQIKVLCRTISGLL